MNSSTIFNKLKDLIQPYETPNLVTTNNEKTYHLDYKLENPTAKPEMFAAVMIKKNYVSMYYMPVYNKPELLTNISPELRKRMHGKSCFNFTDENDESIIELSKLIEKTAKSSRQPS